MACLGPWDTVWGRGRGGKPRNFIIGMGLKVIVRYHIFVYCAALIAFRWAIHFLLTKYDLNSFSFLQGEFVDDGTETHFSIGNHDCCIKAVSSGKRREGIIHTLIVDEREIPESTE